MQKNMIKVRILSWMQTGLFSDKVEKIDFDKLINDNKTISCINSNLLYTEEEKAIAFTIIFEKILEYMITRKAQHRIHLFIREVWDFKGWPDCMAMINQFLRKGRTLGRFGIDVTMDTQRPMDLPPEIRLQPFYHVQFGGDEKDGEALLEVRWIPKEDRFRITQFDVGMCMFVTPNRYDVPVEIPPTRHKSMGGDQDVIKVLIRRYGFVRWSLKKIKDVLKYEFEEPEVVVAKVSEDDRV